MSSNNLFAFLTPRRRPSEVGVVIFGQSNANGANNRVTPWTIPSNVTFYLGDVQVIFQPHDVVIGAPAGVPREGTELQMGATLAANRSRIVMAKAAQPGTPLQQALAPSGSYSALFDAAVQKIHSLLDTRSTLYVVCIQGEYESQFDSSGVEPSGPQGWDTKMAEIASRVRTVLAVGRRVHFIVVGTNPNMDVVQEPSVPTTRQKQQDFCNADQLATFSTATDDITPAADPHFSGVQYETIGVRIANTILSFE